MNMYDHFRAMYPKFFDEFRLISFDCGWGWSPLLKEALDKVQDLGVRICVVQVKEKFGGLRVYVDPHEQTDHEEPRWPEVENILESAQVKSFKTCEGCGTTEEVTTSGGWLKTLCPTCRAKNHWWEPDDTANLVKT